MWFSRLFISLFKEATQEWLADNASNWAAAIAYYTLIALAPLLLIVVHVAGLLLQTEQVQTFIIDEITLLLGADVGQMITDAVEQVEFNTTDWQKAVVGGIVIFVGATAVFAALQNALNNIWRVPDPPTGIIVFIKNRIIAFLLVLSLGLLLILFVILDTILDLFGELIRHFGLWQLQETIVGEWFLSLLIFSLLFAILYKVIPDVKLYWHDVIFGGISTALMFSLGQFGILWYFSTVAVGSIFGAAGTVVVLLVWVYYSAQIFLFGAELTKVYARRREKRRIRLAHEELARKADNVD